MNPASELEILLAKARDLKNQERGAFLAGLDAEMAQQLRRVLCETDSDLKATGTNEVEVVKGLTADQDLLPRPLGPYQLKSVLGEGGMGRVYLATQEEPVRRTVAVKILRWSVDSPETRFRFESERHAMGRLDHPNIAQILEAGTTENHRPYFTMEYIDGTPITQYCDDHGLGIEARLRLFVGVCRGTDHAHNKLILHRDLKPSNLLVTQIDGQAFAKIIDFGIAKEIDRQAGDPLTGNQIIGTPAYMSPESLGLLGNREPDIRSDVYSLGVILYELLTGHRPRKGEITTAFKAVSSPIDSSIRPPSGLLRRLSNSDRSHLASRRGLSESSLPKLLRGDLDGIVMRAIEDRPDNRYGSAAELADDIERHLNHEPVSVRSPSFSYVLGRLLRRHRLVFFSAAAALLAILLGTVVSSIGFIRAKRAESLARQETAIAMKARDETQAVVNFLVDVFRGSGVEDTEADKPPAERTALELLNASAQKIEGELLEQPLVKARIQTNIGLVYRELGLYDLAEKHNQEALDLLQSTPGASVSDEISVRQSLATIAIHKSELAVADEHLHSALELLPSDQAESSQYATLADTLGRVKRRRQLFPEAESLAMQAITIMRGAGEDRRLDLAKCINNLGTTYFEQGKWALAETQFSESYDLIRKLFPPGHSLRAHGAQNLGAAIASQGRQHEAQPLFEQALAELRKIHGNQHPRVAATLNSLGVMSNQMGESEQAESYHREALAIREKMLGSDHPTTAWSLDNLARATADLGRLDEAVKLQSRAAQIRESKLGPDHDQFSRSLEHLGEIYLAQKDYNRSRTASTRAMEIQNGLGEPHHGTLGRIHLQLGKVEWLTDHRDLARTHFNEAVKHLEQDGDSSSDSLAEAREWRAKFEGS